ncbi:hypothetical protein M231_04709 [Tremella mesenterica]|uniref:Uncharacterized protein n=1 Tax=Tremella mesenterica TaxID=5217 RepID=A0A4Q1BK80_TREME|nr:hypothetical protein M231_04709 [Tremella mesenterica]
MSSITGKKQWPSDVFRPPFWSPADKNIEGTTGDIVNVPSEGVRSMASDSSSRPQEPEEEDPGSDYDSDGDHFILYDQDTTGDKEFPPGVTDVKAFRPLSVFTYRKHIRAAYQSIGDGWNKNSLETLAIAPALLWAEPLVIPFEPTSTDVKTSKEPLVMAASQMPKPADREPTEKQKLLDMIFERARGLSTEIPATVSAWENYLIKAVRLIRRESRQPPFKYSDWRVIIDGLPNTMDVSNVQNFRRPYWAPISSLNKIDVQLSGPEKDMLDTKGIRMNVEMSGQTLTEQVEAEIRRRASFGHSSHGWIRRQLGWIYPGPRNYWDSCRVSAAMHEVLSDPEYGQIPYSFQITVKPLDSSLKHDGSWNPTPDNETTNGPVAWHTPRPEATNSGVHGHSDLTEDNLKTAGENTEFQGRVYQITIQGTKVKVPECPKVEVVQEYLCTPDQSQNEGTKVYLSRWPEPQEATPVEVEGGERKQTKSEAETMLEKDEELRAEGVTRGEDGITK